jgi:hypothetical protein
MDSGEIDRVIAVWLAANRGRGKLVDAARRARVRDKLVHPDALVLIAANPAIVGMALAEPGRASEGSGALLPDLMHISMVFVERVSLWTASDNGSARPLYEHAGMTAVARRRINAATEWVRYEAETTPGSNGQLV